MPAHVDSIRGVRRGIAPVPLSVLDLVPVGEGQLPSAAVQTALQLAALADVLGYHRYWVTEHHTSAASASSSPAVLLARATASTQAIRLGSGGVMLPNYAPLLVAEQFGTLEALAPGRIDLGLGRAFGTDKRMAAALRRDGKPQEGNDFAQQVQELAAFLDGTIPDGHRWAGIPAIPGPLQYPPMAGRPPMWILGSSPYSGQLAGSQGLPYAFAGHMRPEGAKASIEAYRESFQASSGMAMPYAIVSVAAFAADTEREALSQLLTGEVATLRRLRTGWNGPLPTPEEARVWPMGPDDRRQVAQSIASTVYGTPGTVRERLDRLVTSTSADELIITAFCHTPSARMRSYTLIAREYGLTGALPASTVPEDDRPTPCLPGACAGMGHVEPQGALSNAADGRGSAGEG